MPIHSFDRDIKLAEELAKNLSYEALNDFLFRKNFTIKLEKFYNLEGKPIDEYGIKNLQLFATKEIEQQPLHVYTLELTTNLTERSSKKRQFDIAKKLLIQDKINIGLFVFHDASKNFRFSLVYKEPLGTKARYSYYKRYTFYVSPNLSNKTFILQVGKCDFETFESIKSAFSVEPVTKQLYDELQAWYYYAMDRVWFPEDYKYSDDPEKDKEIRTALNLIRLITRLIFIWFLKEKELIPDVLFDKEQLKSIVKDFGKGHNYYNAILQNLFFATLNRPINERGWAYDKGYPANKSNFGIKSLYRYEDKFLIPPDEVMKIFSEIPFINGGLFDCLDRDSVYIDGFSRNPKKQAKIPDYLFFQEEEQTVDLSKYGLGRKKFRGLIEILKSYNFTTDEATPIDQEIALDPELLGKVFENLLASYNPETATTARKATGSYYTPREIVDYMVDESLKTYFKTVLPDIPEESIELLLSYSDEVPNLTEEYRLKIAKAIDNLKIIDPACGSGAFPMGALHKLVHILQKIDPDNKIWYKIQLEEASKEADEIFRTEKDKEKREELLRELNENFDTNINEPDYARKLYLIENCIYGVDIQPIAIQISKLRFFISLILDQKVDKSKPNCGILPLPNLETKFIAANTLIGLEKPSNTLHLIYQHTATLERDLKLLRHRYFRIKTRREKEELQKKDQELRKQIANILKKHGWSVDEAEKIASFDPFDQNASADWFDSEWMFGVRDGFDIAIGNPPYGDLLGKDVNKNTKKFVEEYYRFSTTSDISSPFIERGVELLKPGGNLFYIITFAITFNKDFSKSRYLLNMKFKRIEVISFDRDRCSIFESMTQSVSILKAIDYESKHRTGFFTSRMFRETPDIYNIELSPANRYLLPIGTSFEYPHRLPKIGEAINLGILNKLISFKNKIGNALSRNGRLMYIRTSGNYWYNAWDKKPYESSEIKPLYVKEAYYNFIVSIVNTSLFYFWFRIYGDGRHMNTDIFEEFRIPEESNILRYKKLLNYVRKDLMNSLFSVFDEERKRFETRRIKDRLDLADFVICRYLYGFNYNHIKHILDYDKEVRSGIKLDDSILGKVDEILTLTQSSDYETNQEKQQKVKELEKEIDQLVYKLYDLTEDEIAIIENN